MGSGIDLRGSKLTPEPGIAYFVYDNISTIRTFGIDKVFRNAVIVEIAIDHIGRSFQQKFPFRLRIRCGRIKRNVNNRRLAYGIIERRQAVYQIQVVLHIVPLVFIQYGFGDVSQHLVCAVIVKVGASVELHHLLGAALAFLERAVTLILEEHEERILR